MPAELGDLLDRLGGLLRRGGAEEQIGAAVLDLEDLGIDGRLGQFVGNFRHDHLRGLVAEAGLQAVEIILAEVVVLIEHADLGVRMLLQNVLAVDAALDEVEGLKPIVHGKFFGSVNFDAPVAANSCGTFLPLRYFRTAAFGGGADDLERQQHLVALDQLAHLLHRLRRAVGVVILDQIDLAAVHAALVVDHLDVGGLRLADRGIGRGRS